MQVRSGSRVVPVLGKGRSAFATTSSSAVLVGIGSAHASHLASSGWLASIDSKSWSTIDAVQRRRINASPAGSSSGINDTTRGSPISNVTCEFHEAPTTLAAITRFSDQALQVRTRSGVEEDESSQTDADAAR